LIEANLSVEEDPIEVTPLRVVEATPIRRAPQLALVVAAMLAVAAVVGLAFGLTKDLASSPSATDATPVPTAAPTSRFKALFRATLPPHSIESLQESSSSQYRAFQRVAENYKNLGFDPQSNQELQRATQRFALATLFVATAGETSWNSSDF
jgi:hypothetical protein